MCANRVSWTDDTIPETLTGAQRQRRYRETGGEARAKRKYRHDNSKWQTDEHYLARTFHAWDGEGVTTPDGVHRYVMLATGRGCHIVEPDGLSTAEILEFVCQQAEVYDSDIHIIYGGGYDFNMWVKDFARTELEQFYRQDYMRWEAPDGQKYRLGWRPGKSLYIARLNDFGQALDSVMIYDVVSFFQTTFVNACDDYLGDKFWRRDLIVENKALRSTFQLSDIPKVREYNDAELVNLETLMGELRDRLNKVGLRPRRWDGPGAVATALLQRERVKQAQTDTPPEVARASRFAYAGGRFEVVRFGSVGERAYEYDVNSAYPSALRMVPNLNAGTWVRRSGDPGTLPYALYHVQAVAHYDDLPGPLFRRDPNGTICYPTTVTGWYWSPEVEAVREYCAAGYGEMTVIEAWVFEHDPEAPKPFDFVEGLYNKRRALKKARDGAHVGIKLGLNSLYGKLAQQVGWKVLDDGSLRLPPFHQLEWAGFTTSHCRAAVLRAALTAMDAVIAFETDAVFASRPLAVPLGTNLGDFEYTEFERLTYVQSGLYFGVTTDGKRIDKTRGVDRGTLTESEVIEGMQRPIAAERIATASLTRFVGAGVALSQSLDRWRKWETVDKRITLEPTGKRMHAQCPACADYLSGISPIRLGVWHSTFCPMMDDAHSSEFPIEWINPDPNMTELEEMRRTVEVYDD